MNVVDELAVGRPHLKVVVEARSRHEDLAAGPLAVHLLRHGRIGSGDEIEIEQGAEIGRPSRLFARVDGTPEAIDRVEVGGSAVIVARGEFRLP